MQICSSVALTPATAACFSVVRGMSALPFKRRSDMQTVAFNDYGTP